MPTQSRGRACRDQRREEGEARNATWRALTLTAQLQSLDARLGAGNGAKRQRAKLATPGVKGAALRAHTR